jgi:hypothetical protein
MTDLYSSGLQYACYVSEMIRTNTRRSLRFPALLPLFQTLKGDGIVVTRVS